jgi:hypothetical protein
LLAIAFDYLGEGVPVVVGVKDVAAAELVHSWPRLDVDDIGRLADAVHERLAAGPVLILPPWDEPPSPHPDGGVRPGRVLPPEAVLLECRPAGASTPMLMAKSGHTSVASLARYARPSAEALARWQERNDPDRRR